MKMMMMSKNSTSFLPGKTLALSALMAVVPVGTADAQDEVLPAVSADGTSIRLNRNDPSFDMWKRVRSDLSKGREAGPINVQRFEGGFPWIGIPTFFHLPVALTPEDLKAGKVEVAIMGAELVGDMRARTWGPMEMRNPHRSEVYHLWGSFAMPELDSGLNPLQELTVVDYGDAPMEPLSLEKTIVEVRKYVRDIASVEIGEGKRTIPVIIGGGHALMYPDVAGLADVYGKKKIGIIHFDAHFDSSAIGFGHVVTHGNPIRALVNEGIVDPKAIVQVGLRGPTSNDLDGIKWVRDQGIRYHMMEEINQKGWDKVIDEAIKEAKEAAEYLFISFDVDVVDPAFIPGTSTPEPGGMTMREALPICRRLCAEANVIGIELVELRPDSDPGYTTMLNAKALLRQMLNGLAMRKKGLTQDNYVHPWMLDDGN